MNEENTFHKNRIAFMIINEEIIFLERSPMSHREWFDSLNLKLDFNNIVRGFYYNNRIIFYKGDFIYDEETIEKSKKYYHIIVKKYNLDNPELWCGQKKNQEVNPLSNPWIPVLRIDIL